MANVFRALFGQQAAISAAVEAGGTPIEEEERRLHLTLMAIQSAVGFLSAAVAQAEIRTYSPGHPKKEMKSSEYYTWNVRPNRRQNATQFWTDVVETLIYNSECLIVELRNEVYVADTFTIDQAQKAGLRTFRGIMVDNEPIPDRREKDVMYLAMSENDLHAGLVSLLGEYESILTDAIDGYAKSYAEKGILNIDAVQRGKIGQDYDKIKRDLLGRRFKDFFSKKSAVLPLYNGFSYTPQNGKQRTTSEINDVKTLTDEVTNRVGQALRVPAAMLRGDVAGLKDTQEIFIRWGVAPILKMIRQEMIGKRIGENEFIVGWDIVMDMSGIDLLTPFSVMDKLDRAVGSGIYSIDEIRRKTGEIELENEVGQTHFVTKNYGIVGKEGEDNGGT